MSDPGPLLLVSSGIPDTRVVEGVMAQAARAGLAVHAVADLVEELPDSADFPDITTSRLDAYRGAETTIRNAADRSDQLLRSVRALVKGRFEQRGRSLWLAQETYILHFHLLRVVDSLELVGRVLDELRPSRVVCVGPVGLLAKLFFLVAKSRGIPLRLRTGSGLRRKLAAVLWEAQRRLLAWPSLYLVPVYFLLGARRLLRRRAPRKQRDASVSADTAAGAIRVAFIGSNRKQSDLTIQLAHYLNETDLNGTDGFSCRFLNLQDESLKRELDEQGLPVARLSDHREESDASAGAADDRRRFLRDALALFGSPAFRRHFRVPGAAGEAGRVIDFWPITGHYLTRFALAIAPELAASVERAASYFEENPADIVVTPAEWDPRSRACVIAAAALGVPSLSLQRGDITGFPGWADPIFSDRMAVNGPAIANAMIRAGVPEEQLVVTGDSRLDPWIRDAERFFHPGQTREKLAIPQDRRLIAVMTNPVTLNEKASHAEEYVGGLLELERQDESLHFVIKLHPNEYDLAFYERIRDRVGARNVTVIKELSTPQLLFDADVVVTTISTTGEEAIFLGKPLVVVNLTNEPDFMPYVGSAAAVTVRERGLLREGLFGALDDPELRARLTAGRAAYIADHFLSDDGRASDRCAALIRELAGASAP